MVAKKYKFNPKTFTYEVITLPLRIRFYRTLRKLLAAFLFAAVVTVLFSYFFYTPKMHRITQQRNELMIKYDLLHDRIEASEETLAEIRRRDQLVYRSLFGVDTLAIDGIYNPYPESKYHAFATDHYAPMILHAWTDLDALARKVYAGSLSLDELYSLAADKEKMAESIPAIWPIDKNLIRSLGAFGGRFDPVSGRRAMHEGMDFSGKIGTPIYATGNGRIIAPPERGYSGYGRQVLIDHGFGYRTRYAHLNRIDVVPGQIVRRGEKIGELGNTGKSTGPHLHYEVIYRGTPVDPVNYFSQEMSDEDFTRIIESAKDINFETDAY